MTGTMKRLVRHLLPLAAILIVAPQAAQAAPGDLDPSFGVSGKVSLDVEPASELVLRDLIRLPDGKLLAAGGSGPAGSAVLARVHADGQPDQSFGDGGVRKVPGSLWAKLEIQPGKGVIAFGRVGHDPAVARFDLDGNLDPAFGVGGIRLLPIRPLFNLLPKSVETDGPGLDSAGRIIAATSPGGCSQSGRDDNDENRTFGEEECGDLAIARLTPEGAMDPGFGDGDGVRVVAAGAAQVRTALAPDDDILIAGSTYEEYEDYEWADRRWVRRLTPEALPRTDFGDRGWVVLSDGDRPAKAGLIHSSDHGVVTVSFGLVVLRLQPDGSKDSSFGEGGEADARPLEETSAIDPTLTAGRVTDQYIYLAGSGNLRPQSGGRAAVAIRLSASGEPDPTYAADGAATTRIGAPLPDSSATRRYELNRVAMLIDDQGRVTIGATGGRSDARRFTLARFQGGTGKRLSCQGRPATVQGTAGDDLLLGSQDSVIAAGAGDDVIEQAGGLICAGRGDDRISDRRSWGHGVDAIFAGPGNDRIEIVTQARFVYGEQGNDRIIGQVSKAEGGPGNDLLDGGKPSRRTPGFDNTLLGGPGNDRLIGRQGHDQLFGGPGRDLLLGGPGDDLMEGGSGRDRLKGGQGSDVLFGGPGRDRLDAGPAGSAFVWYKASGSRAKGVLGLLRNKFSRGSLDLRTNCSDPETGRYRSWLTLTLRDRITKGRFTISIDYRDEDGNRDSGKIRGKVTPRSIVIDLNLSMSRTTASGSRRCSTGRQNVRLRRLAGRSQIVRQ